MIMATLLIAGITLSTIGLINSIKTTIKLKRNLK